MRIKKEYLNGVERDLESLLWGAVEKQLAKLENVRFLAKFYLKNNQFTKNALTSAIS